MEDKLGKITIPEHLMSLASPVVSIPESEPALPEIDVPEPDEVEYDYDYFDDYEAWKREAESDMHKFHG